MGWAARTNPTVRDEHTPVRVSAPPSRLVSDDLAVFSPICYTPKKPDGSPVLDALGKPIVVTGFGPNAKTGQSLFDSAAANAGYERATYTFDGHALRRSTVKAKGKSARRKDKHARRTGAPA